MSRRSRSRNGPAIAVARCGRQAAAAHRALDDGTLHWALGRQPGVGAVRHGSRRRDRRSPRGRPERASRGDQRPAAVAPATAPPSRRRHGALPVLVAAARLGEGEYSVAMAKRTQSELVVDLRGRPIETLDDFWDAMTEPCGLPEWFGRNVTAWGDTLHTRGISEVIDSFDVLVVHVDKRGIFAQRNVEARSLRRAFAGRHSRLVVHEPS